MSRTSADLAPGFPGKSRLAPELALVIACLSQRPETLPEIGRDFDWEGFLFWTRRHRIHPLVLPGLRRLGAELAPLWLREKLKSRVSGNLIQSLKQAAELARLSQVLSQAGLAHLPLKGPWLSQRLFGDPGLRQSVDLDVLVQPREFGAALAALSEAGYERHRDYCLTPRQERAILSRDEHIVLVRPGQKFPLELHWRAAAVEPETDWWFEHSQPAGGLGRTARELKPSALVLYLCLHGALHQWNRLKWLADIDRLLQIQPELDWAALTELAQTLGLQRSLGQGLLLANRLLGTNLPGPLKPLIRSDRKIIFLARLGLRAICLRQDTPSQLPLCFKPVYHYGCIAAFPRLKLSRYLADKLYSTADFKNFSLADRYFWLYPILKPYIWLKRRLQPSE